VGAGELYPAAKFFMGSGSAQRSLLRGTKLHNIFFILKI
jgi:hypothetical protein